MKFKKIKVKNLRSYKDEEINFPDGSLLITGDIGSGKTSILLAIEYALFGLQAGQKGNALLRNNQNSAEVTLELEVQGKQIIIERSLKRTQKGVTNDYAAITIEGEKYEASLTEIKHKIISLLNYPEEFIRKNNVLYRYTVYTQQEAMKQIILDDAETRLNTLRNVFGIEKYKTIKNNLAILITDLKTNAKIFHAEIATLQRDKQLLKKREELLDELDTKRKKIELERESKSKIRLELEQEKKEIEQKTKEQNECEKEIEKTKIMLLTKKETLVLVRREKKEIEQMITETRAEYTEEKYKNLLKQRQDHAARIEKLNTQLIECAGKINALEQEKQEMLGKKDRIFKIDICPTCLQDVADSHKHNILNETETKLTTIQKKNHLFEQEKRELQSKISQNRESLQELEAQKQTLEKEQTKREQLKIVKQKLIELNQQEETLRKDEEMLFKHFNNLKDKKATFSRVQNQHKRKEDELNQARENEKQVEITLATINREQEIEKREIDLAIEHIQQKETVRKKARTLTELIDWLTSRFLNLIELIEQSVLLKLRTEFSNLFRKWFIMLVPEDSLDARLDENFTPIITQGEVEMDYNILSGGERTAVALAYRLALNQTINSLRSNIQTKGIIMLDEPTDGFSETQIDKIRNVLEELETEQLIIISHEPKIEGFIENVFRVTKNNDLSTIAEK